MQKKYLLILILLLAGVGTWFYFRNTKSGTTDESKTMFAIKNPEDITKVFISNKLQGQLLLEKKNGIWMVNGKYEAFKPTMDLFLNQTLKKVRVAGPVPLPARSNVISSMATMATKVEIYVNNDLAKVYYVGQPTNEMTGTYMYLSGSEDPYITHIPGFNGFLTSRFSTLEKEWITKVVFDYKPEEIKSVDIFYPADKNSSFTVSRKSQDGDFEVTAEESAPNGALNYASVKSYFNVFGFICAEGFMDYTPMQMDTLKQLKPYCVITVTHHNDKVRKVRVSQRPSSDRDHGLYDKNGNRLTYDPSRYNAIIDNEDRALLIQDINFAPIMIKYSDFFLKQHSD